MANGGNHTTTLVLSMTTTVYFLHIFIYIGMLFKLLIIACVLLFPGAVSAADDDDNEVYVEMQSIADVNGNGLDGIVRPEPETIDTLVRKLSEVKEAYGFGDAESLGLSDNCNNLNCDFFYYFLTCKQFGLHMDKICASYFVGWAFKCSDYPPAEDISDAPSVCLGQFATAAVPLIQNPSAYFSNVVFDEPYKEVCTENCYQNYVRSATEFMNVCYSDLEAEESPLLNLYALNSFLGQSCGKCYLLFVC